MNDLPPWEPPLAGTDVDHLLGSLDRLRATFRWKAGGLDADGLRTRVGPSELTLGSLLKHLAIIEDHCSTSRLHDRSIGLPWTEIHDGTPDWEFRTVDGDSPEQLYAWYDGAVVRARERYAAAIAEGGSTGRRRSTTRRVTTRVCGGCCRTWSRSTVGTPATPTCCARPSTDSWGRIPHRTGGHERPDVPRHRRCLRLLHGPLVAAARARAGRGRRSHPR